MMKKIVVLTAVALLAGCATPQVVEKETVENFKDANYYFSKGKYDASEKLYHKVMDEAPDSPYRIHALLGVADSYYMQGEFVAAAPMYVRFVELYPMDDRTPHALFYQAMSYYNDLVKVERDQTNARKALETFTKFIKQYPNHPAVPFAREKVVFLNDRLAQKLFVIAEYYFKTGGYISCIGRVDDLLQQYPETRFRGQALVYKAKSYAGEEAYDKAKEVFLRIAFEFRGSDLGRQAEAQIDAIEKLQN